MGVSEDPRSKNDFVTCTSCHDLHGDKHEFILLADRERDLCFWCHSM
ncbi:cytochrome c3 family protein [Candidatus Poribacteria bacterium]